jgi:two-component sensor histidine kinase
LADDGVGIQAGAGEGLGLGLIARLTEHLGGTAEWTQSGTGTRLTCRFTL